MTSQTYWLHSRKFNFVLMFEVHTCHHHHHHHHHHFSLVCTVFLFTKYRGCNTDTMWAKLMIITIPNWTYSQAVGRRYIKE